VLAYTSETSMDAACSDALCTHARAHTQTRWDTSARDPRTHRHIHRHASSVLLSRSDFRVCINAVCVRAGSLGGGGGSATIETQRAAPEIRGRTAGVPAHGERVSACEDECENKRQCEGPKEEDAVNVHAV